MMEVIDLQKFFLVGEQKFMVLKGISLRIKKGEFVGIVGRSGAGKSTLLYQLGLLDTPSSGVITVGNVRITDLNNGEKTRYRLKNFGFVFQDYALIPELTAIENVAIPLIMLGFSKNESYKRAVAVLHDVGLEDKKNNMPGALSGGEQQRVGIARAVVHKPAVIFADEPTASLDTKNSHEIMELFKKLHDQGLTILMVTHEIENTKYMDRVITVEDGRIK